MKKILITGGNSGIGKEAARQLVQHGHDVTIVGRDETKGKAAVAELAGAGQGQGEISFIAADLSTIAGLRRFAGEYSAANDSLDVLIQCAGVLTAADLRTADDLHAVFAVNYLSRVHLAERLLPLLKKSTDPRVVLLVAGVPLDSKVNFDVFPRYKPFPGLRSLSSIQIANFHYAQHLAAAEPQIAVGVVNAGLVKTDIMRAMPGILRFLFNLLAPIMTVPVATSAANLVHGAEAPRWSPALYWAKPGKSAQTTPLALDAAVTARVVAETKKLVGLD